MKYKVKTYQNFKRNTQGSFCN